jgi:hypothetical protein
LNKPKRSLRTTLADLAAAFADAVLAAARESVLELATEQAPQTRRPRSEPARSTRSRGESVERPQAARAPRTPSRAARKPSRALSDPPVSPGGDLLITDPQALLAALETADPSTAWESASAVQTPRAEPEILRPVAPATAPVSHRTGSGSDPGPQPDQVSMFAPVLREGEVIVRRSAGGVVLRRRRA